MRSAAACIALLVTVSPALAQNPDLAMPRPIDAADTVWIEEMTWLEVRDAL